MARFTRLAPKTGTVAISTAPTPEAARSVLVLSFNDEAEMYHPTKFQQNLAVCGSFIDDSTNLRFLETLGFCSS